MTPEEVAKTADQLRPHIEAFRSLQPFVEAQRILEPIQQSLRLLEEARRQRDLQRERTAAPGVSSPPIQFSVSPSTARRLVSLADAEGLSLDAFLKQLLRRVGYPEE